MQQLRKVAIVGGARIPFVRSFTHYNQDSNQDMLTTTIRALVDRFALRGERLGEVACGAVIKHPADWNLARESLLGAGLDPRTPGFDIVRACGTSLEATIQIANKIALGQIESGIAGGSDSNSDLPLVLKKKMAQTMIQLGRAKSLGQKVSSLMNVRPKDFVPVMPAVVEPRTGLSMGQHCELMAQQWQISREEQDELAYQSHMTGIEAYRSGFYEDLVVEFRGLRRDTILRADTTHEQLAKLKPAFERSAKGTLTAGNSTALTDGASAVFLCSEDYARKHDLPIQAYFVDAQAYGVDFVGGEGLLMAPTFAVAEMLKRQKMKLQDFAFYEIHEAFAAQVLCTLKAWESNDYCRDKMGLGEALGAIDRKRMNVRGGSVALGHPFGATGARLVGTLGKILAQSDQPGARGLISVCTGGGMGVAAILEKA